MCSFQAAFALAASAHLWYNVRRAYARKGLIGGSLGRFPFLMVRLYSIFWIISIRDINQFLDYILCNMGRIDFLNAEISL